MCATCDYVYYYLTRGFVCACTTWLDGKQVRHLWRHDNVDVHVMPVKASNEPRTRTRTHAHAHPQLWPFIAII